MTKTKKLFAAILAALMVLAVLPVSSFAAEAAYQANEAAGMKRWDDVWAVLDAVEAEMMEQGANRAEVVYAVYKAALNCPLIDKGSITDLNDNEFSFTTDGMVGGYNYRVRNFTKAPAKQTNKDLAIETTSRVVSNVNSTKSSCGCAGAVDVLLVGPYYGSDSSFTDQYKTEAASIAAATGGTLTTLSYMEATGPAIASNYTNKGVVIYDSHGNCIDSKNTSYLDLNSSSGLTTTDYTNGWAYNGGSFYGIDGRYIQNHVSGTLSNCIVWMAICQGMKKEGQGTTGTALLAAGAGCVYGYSQSVSFTGDYEYEETFWTQMKNGATVADAIAVMKSTHGNWDPAYSSSSGAAWPIVMSAVDAFPSNPDGTQTVNCDWTLFSQDPIALESFDIANNAGTVITSATVAQGKSTGVKIVANPSNANTYTVEWSVADSSVATVTPAANGKSATVTGVAPGATTLTATVTDESKTVMTKSITINVTEAPQWYPADTIVPGEEYLIGFVVDGVTYLAVNYNVSASNHYYNSISYNYYGYTAPATMNGQNVIGVSGNADDLDYCTWVFQSEGTGLITSGYQSGYYLQAYSGTSYPDLYPGTNNNFTWTYDADAHTLYTYTSTTRYAQYYTNGSLNLMGVTSNVPTNSYVQLYSMTAPAVEPTYYTVTFKDWDGAVLATQTVEEGTAAIAPADPTREGYTFTGWDVAFNNVTSDLVVTAQYTINTYTVTFKDWDGTVLSTQTVEHGSAATAPADPTREGYTFAGWDVAFNNVTSDLIVTATYTENQIEVSLLGDVNCDGKVDMGDISALSAYLLGKGQLSEQGIVNADASGNGSLDSSDLSAIFGLM